ncbi:MAG: hypothetical protein ACRET8_12195 [Burkholderiales bacterium]
MRTLFLALVLSFVQALAGCTYYVAPGGPASFDRSWDAATGALHDQGLEIVRADRSTGVVTGRRGMVDVTARVRSQADGSVRVEFNTPGSGAPDRDLMERVSRAYDARMGR